MANLIASIKQNELSYIELCKQHRTTSPLITEWDFKTDFSRSLSDETSRLISDMRYDMRRYKDYLARKEK